jgi:hypothetical protein
MSIRGLLLLILLISFFPFSLWAATTMTIAGEPGRHDFAKIVIKDKRGKAVLSVEGNLRGGNHQAHRK